MLLHGLKHGRLCLGSGTVDLVCKHDLGEDGPFLEFEEAVPAALVFNQHIGSHDVGRHQVRCELDA